MKQEMRIDMSGGLPRSFKVPEIPILNPSEIEEIYEAHKKHGLMRIGFTQQIHIDDWKKEQLDKWNKREKDAN